MRLLCFSVFVTLCLFSRILQAQEAGYTEGYKQVNGTRIYYKSVGEGPPLLIIHGGPAMNHNYFLPHLVALAKKRKLIFYDQRASGLSDIPADSSKSISYQLMIDDIEALRKAFNIKKLDLLAHSWGAKLAINYALEYPDKTGKMVLVCPITLNHNYDSLQLATLNSRIIPGDRARKNDLINSPGFTAGDLAVYEKLLRITYKTSFFDTANLLKMEIVLPDNFFRSNAALMKGLMSDHEMYDINYYPKLIAIKTPVLIIHGIADNIPLAADERLKESLTNAQLIVMDQSGHFPFIEQKNDFIKSVAAFLDKK